MRLAHLRSFYAAARYGGFTAGARQLHVSQPTVTSQVRALEGSYGVELFHRHGHRLELSDVGRELLAIAQRIFGLEEDAILTRAKFDVHATASLMGAGSVVLRGTVHDPLDEIPVRSVTRATYTECDLIGKCEAVATTPANVFLPYHYGRHDDWSALDTESARLVPVA